MENLFLFLFCLRDLFVEREDAPCYARPIHRKGALALGQFPTCAILSHTMIELLHLVDSLDSMYFCQTHSTTFCLFPVIVCERIARVENCPSARAPFEYTKRWGAQLCIRWYIDPYRWHGQFNTIFFFL